MQLAQLKPGLALVGLESNLGRKRRDSGASQIFKRIEAKAEAARQLAYRLYPHCERRDWAEDARAYNEVVTGWSGIESAAAKVPSPVQATLFNNEESK